MGEFRAPDQVKGMDHFPKQSTIDTTFVRACFCLANFSWQPMRDGMFVCCFGKAILGH